MLHKHEVFAAKLSVCSLAVMAALGISPAAYGQANPAAGTSQVAEEIVVSASRIERAGFTAPTPTTVVGTKEIEARAAVTLADIINDIPQNRPTTTGVGLSQAGVNVLNLRNLNVGGAIAAGRSLFLVDGLRVVGSNRQGQVNTATVPTSLIERIEVVTGGASAAWGSDAVAGVSSIVFKKRLQGFEGTVQYGESQRGDNKATSMSLAWGQSFAEGRGQVMVAGEYSKLSDPPTFGDRDWGRNRQAYVTRVVNGLIYQNAPATGLGLLTFTPGGVITGANTSLTTGGAVPNALGNATTNTATVFGTSGVPQQLIRSTDPAVTSGSALVSGTSSALYGVGGYGPWYTDTVKLGPKNERSNIFVRSTFDFTDTMQGFAEASYSTDISRSNTSPAEFIPGGVMTSALTIARTNPYLIATGLVLPANIQTITLGKIADELGLPTAVNNVVVKRIAFGGRGEFTDNWSWRFGATHSESIDDNRILDNKVQAKLHAAVNVVNGPNGIICNPNSLAYLSLSAANRTACVPANPFGPNSFTSAVRDYVNGTSIEHIVSRLDEVVLSTQAEPFSLWAGPVSVVGGVEYRHESLNVTVDDLSASAPVPVDFGITLNGGWQYVNAKGLNGDQKVKEFFGETLVPLLKDLPLAKSLDFNAAARRTLYSVSGGVKTWKVGLTYQPVQDILIRGTNSRDIRAPSLAERYSAKTLGGGTIAPGADPLNLTSNYIMGLGVYNGGNTGLAPEQARTKSIGISWTPSMEALKGFSAGVDYYRIQIKGAIAALGQQNIIDGCGNGVVTTGTTAPAGQPSVGALCARIERRDTNNNIVPTSPNTTARIYSVDPSLQNIGFIEQRGVDVELGYRLPLSRLSKSLNGNFGIRALGSRTLSNVTQATPTSLLGANTIGTFTGAGASNPRWTWTVNSDYQNGPLSMNLQGTYIGPAELFGVGTPSATTTVANTFTPEVAKRPSRWTFNTGAAYVIYNKPDGGRLQIYGNIRNLLDKDPLPGYASTGSAPTPVAGGYDVMGRAFILGLRFRY